MRTRFPGVWRVHRRATPSSMRPATPAPPPAARTGRFPRLMEKRFSHVHATHRSISLSSDPKTPSRPGSGIVCATRGSQPLVRAGPPDAWSRVRSSRSAFWNVMASPLRARASRIRSRKQRNSSKSGRARASSKPTGWQPAKASLLRPMSRVPAPSCATGTEMDVSRAAAPTCSSKSGSTVEN